MHITALEEYGLRCALQLAALQNGASLSASLVAEREGISVEYASKILHLFRKAQLVSATRGVQGGFRFVRPVDQINVKEIFAAVGTAKKNGEFCTHYKGLHEQCVHLQACSVRPVWEVLVSYFDRVLEKLTLADLVHPENLARKRVELFAQTESAQLKNLFQTSAPAAAPVATAATEH